MQTTQVLDTPASVIYWAAKEGRLSPIRMFFSSLWPSERTTRIYVCYPHPGHDLEAYELVGPNLLFRKCTGKYFEVDQDLDELLLYSWIWPSLINGNVNRFLVPVETIKIKPYVQTDQKV